MPTFKGKESVMKKMPRANRSPLEVIQLPLSSKRVIKTPNFGKLPRLYLELLQNPSKIKADFIREEFIPDYDTADPIFDNDGDDISINVSKMRPNKLKSDKPRSGKENRLLEKTEQKEEKEVPEVPEVPEEPEENFDPDILGDEPFQTEESPAEPDQNDPIAAFLRKSRSIGSRKSDDNEKRKKSYQKSKEEFLRNEEKKEPPSLAEIEDGGAFETGGIKDLTHISKREQEAEQKIRQYIHKFDLLKMSHSNLDIPKFTLNSDPEYVARIYDDILRKITTTDTLTKHKKYLMFGFMAVEALGGNILGFDMKGFTKQQQIEMASYDKLLIELGEKNYTPQSNWPVELRLLGLIIINAAFFVAGKMAIKATGVDVLNSMNTAANAGASAAVMTQKPRMNGPNISLDDIQTGPSNHKDSSVIFIDPKVQK